MKFNILSVLNFVVSFCTTSLYICVGVKMSQLSPGSVGEVADPGP